MKKYLYKKIYEQLNTGSLFLTNPHPMLEYINEKVKLLENADSDIDLLNIKIDIINEFYKIAKFDEKNSVVPEPFGYFENQQEKENFKNKILFEYDFCYYLGNIFYEYHKSLLNKKERIPIIDENKFMFSIVHYDELYSYALNEYYVVLAQTRRSEEVKVIHRQPVKKQIIDIVDYRGVLLPMSKDIPNEIPTPITNEYAYGATYILPSLIEHFLIIDIQSKLIHTLINNLKEKIENENIRLNDEENDYFNAFNQKDNKIFTRDEKYVRNFLYNMLLKYNIVDDNDKDKKLIILNKYKNDEGNSNEIFTLGSILSSHYAKSIIKRPYFRLLNSLFNPNSLNIRNNIAHGNSINMDYLSIGFTSVMMQLLWNIMTNDIFI